MKILFLINKAGGGGSERFVLELAGELKRRGEDCALAYCQEGPLAEKWSAAGLKLFRVGLERADHRTAPKKIAQICRSEGVDVIHAQFPRENIYALQSLKYFDKPKVVFTDHLSLDRGLKWRILNHIYCKKLTGAAAVWSGGLDALRRSGFPEDRICIINNGVRISTQDGPGLQPDDARKQADAADGSAASDVFECCVLSRYSPEKGLDMLLDSIKLLDPELPFRCTIYGDGGLFGHIAERIKTEGLEGRVVQAGYIQDTRSALLRSRLYLSPSDKEAMSMALLEALAAGLPCVVTDAGSSRSIAEDDPRCGICVKTGDAEGFAAAIKRYMEDEEMRSAHASAALKKAEAYSLQHMADRYLKLYKDGPRGI